MRTRNVNYRRGHSSMEGRSVFVTVGTTLFDDLIKAATEPRLCRVGKVVEGGTKLDS